jgi:CRP/FNR family transcriptional regulator
MKKTEFERKDIHNSKLPLICQACEARHKGVCGSLSEEQLSFLSKHTNKRVFEDGTELYAMHGDQTTYSNILSGAVKLTKSLEDGRQQIVGLQFAPDFLGRPFSSQNDVTAEAATNVRICSFPKAVLEQIINEAPDMEHRLYRQALKELDEARDWMLTLGRKSAYEKVASFLYMIAQNINPERDPSVDNIIIDLPMKRADIADFLGLTIETVSRQITNLRKAGVIDVKDRRAIHVLSFKALKAASEKN